MLAFSRWRQVPVDGEVELTISMSSHVTSRYDKNCNFVFLNMAFVDGKLIVLSNSSVCQVISSSRLVHELQIAKVSKSGLVQLPV